MDENDVKIGTACMNKIQEVLKEFGCGIEIIFSVSSLTGPGWMIKTSPIKNIVVASQIPIPKIKIQDN